MKLSPTTIATARRVLLGVASLGTLFACFISIENWRGDQAWHAVETALKSRGAPVDVSELQQRPSLPAERNFFATPFFAALVHVSPTGAADRQKLLQETRMAALGLGLTGAKHHDLAQLRDHLQTLKLLDRHPSADAAADIREALKPADAVLDELQRAATERPDAQLPFRWPTDERHDDISTLFEVGGALLLRATAEVALGRPEPALADIVTVFRMVDGLSQPPATLIHYLAAHALRALASVPVREGLSRHAWSEPQLARLQALWSDYPAIARFRTAFETDRALAVSYIDSTQGQWTAEFRPWWLFHGWAQQSKASYAEFMEEKLLPALEIGQGRIPQERLAELERAVRDLQASRLPYLWLAREAGAQLASVLPSFARNENTSVLAPTAIALERHRLAQGSYAETLGPLVPRFLPDAPRDVITGKPFAYARLPEGGFTLMVDSTAAPNPKNSWTQAN